MSVESSQPLHSSNGVRDPSQGRLRVDRQPTRRLRVALYSHDAMGVGHVRRNLLIAQNLNMDPHRANTLMICGVHEATAFCGGHGVDCLTIPSLEKCGHNDYRPRDLELPKQDVVSIRKATLTGSLAAFQPDLMLVDKVPKGLEDELVDVLPMLRASGTRIVFGMREILDEPQRVQAEWHERNYESFIADNYDQVWVYGDRSVFDPLAAYGLESLRAQTEFTGYFDQRQRLQFADATAHSEESLVDENSILCMVGGGQDGVSLARAFSQAEFPAGQRGVLITGPLMDAVNVAALETLAAERGDLTVVRCVPEADLLVKRAGRVICMGGYNSMMSVVSFERPALIVPRVAPRLEQSIRAHLFRDLDLVDVLESAQLGPAAISSWLAAPPTHARPDRKRLDLNAGQAIRSLVTQMFPAENVSPSPQCQVGSLLR